MIAKLRERPLTASLLLVLLYGLWFVVPIFFSQTVPDSYATVGIKGAIKMWRSELITASVLILFLSLMGWWQKIGFRRIEWHGIKFLLPIIFLILLLLNLAWVFDKSNAWFMGFVSPMEMVSFFAVLLLLGLVEEGVFRGVFFYGLSRHFSPLVTVLVSAGVFGAFHFVNIFTGEAPLSALFQATHAAAMGFLYGSLRLQIVAIWPLMILHGLWDASIFILQSTAQAGEKLQVDPSSYAGLIIALPALLYGSFVFWRWTKRGKRSIEVLEFHT